MQKILVTGANGQLGSELRACAKSMAGFEFLFTDVAELDITNAAQVKDFCERHKPNFIINCDETQNGSPEKDVRFVHSKSEIFQSPFSNPVVSVLLFSLCCLSSVVAS